MNSICSVCQKLLLRVKKGISLKVLINMKSKKKKKVEQQGLRKWKMELLFLIKTEKLGLDVTPKPHFENIYSYGFKTMGIRH